MRARRRASRATAAGLVVGVLVGVLAACGPGGGGEGPSSARATSVTATGGEGSSSAPATTVAATTDEEAGDAGTTAPTDFATTLVDVDGQPFRLHLPRGHDPATPVPLLVGLHGYTSSSDELDVYFGLTAASDERGFLLALPDGLRDQGGDQYWNAVEGGCCDFYGAGTDDSTYLSHLVGRLTTDYAVSTVAFLGHSNGGYMSHRFACDHADQVDAIASLAGPLPYDTSSCRPSEPVRVLHVHGDADETVPYGGRVRESADSATDTAATWARLDGCTPSPAALPTMDLEASIPGSETTATRYADGCRDGGGVELWTIVGGAHVPDLSPDFTPAVLDFLFG